MSREDIIRQRQKEETKVFNELITQQAANVAPAERAVFQSFANVGRMLSGKSDSFLTEDERKKFAMMEAANKRMREVQSSPDWAAKSPQERAMASKQALADSALEAGDVGTYTTIVSALAKEQAAAEKAAAELKALNARVDASESTTALNRVKTDNALTDAVDNSFVVPGPDGKYNYENPDIRVGGFDRKRGGYVDTSGNLFQKGALPIGDFTKLQKERGLMLRDKNGELIGGKEGFDALMKLVPSAQRTQLKNMSGTAAKVGTVTSAVYGLMKNIIDNGQTPESILKTSGSILTFVDDLSSTVKGLTGAFETGERARFAGKINVGGDRANDGSLVGGTWMSIEEYAQKFGDSIGLPKNVQLSAEDAALYKSNMMQLFYLSALTKEPGSRALSDQDIKNAMESLGAQSGDPFVVATRLFDNAAMTYNDLFNAVDQVQVQAGEVGVPPDRAVRLIFGLEDTAKAQKDMEMLGQQMQFITSRTSRRQAAVPGNNPAGWASGLPSAGMPDTQTDPSARAAKLAEYRARAAKAKEAK